jgi:Tfp pilus assembly protein PilP
MVSPVQRLGWLIVPVFLFGILSAQQTPAQKTKDSVEKPPREAPMINKTTPEPGQAVKIRPGTPSKEEEPVKTEDASGSQKNPAPGIATPIRRDPFRPFTLNARGTPARRSENLSPLERYELGQLKLVGVLWDMKEPNAMVEDSAGLGYRIKVGTLIGSNDGKVKAIQRDGIVVEEFYVDLYGAKSKREVKIRLFPEKTE